MDAPAVADGHHDGGRRCLRGRCHGAAGLGAADVVLTAYLTALVAGDRPAAHALTRPKLHGGERRPVRGYRGVAFTPLTVTSGSDDGSVVTGDKIWFYSAM